MPEKNLEKYIKNLLEKVRATQGRYLVTSSFHNIILNTFQNKIF